MSKKDYSKCPKCKQQIYIYVGDSNEGYYHCYKATKDLEQGEEVEITEGSRLDRADEVQDCIDYTCDIGLAGHDSDACGEIYCKSKQEMIWTSDYQNIYARKAEANEKYSELDETEISVPANWVKENINSNLLNDKDFALWALKIDGILLEHFSKAIKSDSELVKIAIDQSAKACLYIDESLLKSKKTILDLLSSQRELLDNIELNHAWLNEKGFVEGIIEVLGWGFIGYIGAELWKDLDFIKKCIEHDGNIICSEKFPEALKNEVKLMVDALNHASETDSLILALPKNITSNLSFWQNAKDNLDDYTYKSLYKFFPNKLKESKEEFLLARENSDNVFLYAPKEFKNKEDILDFILNQVKDENSLSDEFVIYARSIGDEPINKQLDIAQKKELCSNPWDDGDALNIYAWEISQSENKEWYYDFNNELNVAAACCIRSIAVKECHEIFDTYSHVLFRLGDFQKALLYENKAIELATKIGDDTEDYSNFSKEIKSNMK
jgi:hypothetical protein